MAKPFKFVIDKDPEDQPILVTLDQDDGDVNIEVNGETVAWFAARDGRLHLLYGLARTDFPEGMITASQRIAIDGIDD